MLAEKHSINIIRSKRKIIRFLLRPVLLIALSIWLLLKDSSNAFDVYLGWFGTALFGLSIVSRLIILFDNRVQVKIDAEGILDRRLKTGLIKWEQIESAKLYKGFPNKYVSLKLDQSATLSMNKTNLYLNNFLGAGNINLNISQLDFEPELLVNIVNGLLELNLDERKELLAKMK